MFNVKVETKFNDKKILDNLSDALEETMYYMEGEAIRLAPVKTGNLRAKIKAHKINPFEWILADGVDYGVFLEFGCFLGTSDKYRILTKRGYRKLKNVKIGDYVLTHKNQWRKVVSKPEYEVNRQIKRYTIKTKDGKKVTVTDEHPFLTKRGWIKAKDLEKTDILMVVD